ncbi:MAG: two-component sensor histidine kinase [Sphingomonas sp. 28-62-20]|uniref:sensor histidine kinase n=1 Tax=Sphingomonas sp. 28-62-20 TaxID=1970433 RepID=UPI000BCDE61F|nr:MAG: two-component sensor histidine kinase [Sphingomonas sp. 28-62-20]
MTRWWRGTFGLVALVAFGFALATLAIGVVAFETTHEALEQQLDHRIAAETKALIDEGDDGPTGIAMAIRRREAARSTASLTYRLVDAAGRQVAGQLDTRVPKIPGYVELLPYTSDGERRVAQSLTTILPSGHRLLVAADRGIIDEMDATLLRLFAGAFGAMLLLGIAAAWIVGAVTRARLARIDRTALAIIDGDLTQRVPVTGSGDEFDGVAATLNRMLDRIGGLMDNLRQVSSDVAHDLRTPLTRLHNRLDEALASDDRAVQREAIEAAATEARDLLEIFAALLRIAEVEGMSARAHFTDVALSALVTDVTEVYRPAMEASGHRLATAIATGIIIHGDRRLVQRLLSNLLDNAIVHTPAGTKVTVSLERIAARVRLSVADDGPGVSPEAAATVFQRFVRADSSRSTSGHGLGLAMVSAIVVAHGGSVAVQPSPGFSITVDIDGR